MKNEAKNYNSLTFKRKLPDGRIVAIHAWKTGYQTLIIKSLTHFETLKASIENPDRKGDFVI